MPKVRVRVRAKFETILNEEANDVFTLVLANRRRSPGIGIEVRVLLLWCIVKEVPRIEEAVAGHAATGTFLLIKETRAIPSKLNGVAANDLSGDILERVGPLIQDAADVRSEGIHGDATDGVDIVRGKSDGRLWVGVDLHSSASRRH